MHTFHIGASKVSCLTAFEKQKVTITKISGNPSLYSAGRRLRLGIRELMSGFATSDSVVKNSFAATLRTPHNPPFPLWLNPTAKRLSKNSPPACIYSIHSLTCFTSSTPGLTLNQTRMEKISANGIALTHPDAFEIINILDEQALGWNQGDAKTYSEAFSEDGCFTNIFGMFNVGYPDFFRKHDMILNGVFKDSVFAYKLVHLKFINDVAITDTLITVSGFNKSGAFNKIYTDAEGRMYTRLLQVFAKQNDTWNIIAYHNVDIKEGVAIPELL